MSSLAYEPTLKLFLSADLINSTRLKYEKEKSREWVTVFTDFYNNLKSEYSSNRKKAEFSDDTEIWKSLGDEIIFIEHIVDIGEVQRYIECFKDAISRLNNTKLSNTKDKSSSAKLKATAWLAETPVTNAIIPDWTLVSDKKDSKAIDVIGRSMDIGFRISKYSSDRKFVVSVEIARILCEDDSNPLYICFDGEEELKGVQNGIAYPIIWIDMRNGNPTNTEMLLNNIPIKNLPILKSYLDEYIDDKDYLRFSSINCLKLFLDTTYHDLYKKALIAYGLTPDSKDYQKYKETLKKYKIELQDMESTVEDHEKEEMYLQLLVPQNTSIDHKKNIPN